MAAPNRPRVATLSPIRGDSERELQDVRVALQEVGFIASRREVVVAQFMMDETTPFGFFSHLQGGRIPDEGVSYELVEPLLEKLARIVPRRILPTLIRRVASASGFRQAEFLMEPLVPLFPLLTPWEAQALAKYRGKRPNLVRQ